MRADFRSENHDLPEKRTTAAKGAQKLEPVAVGLVMVGDERVEVGRRGREALVSLAAIDATFDVLSLSRERRLGYVA